MRYTGHISLAEVVLKKMSQTDTDTDPLSPEVERLIDLVEGNLHYIARMPLTLKQAVAIKSRLATPLGALGSRHGLRAGQVAKKIGRKALYAKSD